VVGVVQADADQLADMGDGRADAHAGLDLRQAQRVNGAQFIERPRIEHPRADIEDVLRQVAQAAISGDQRRFLLAHRAIAQQFHALFSGCSARTRTPLISPSTSNRRGTYLSPWPSILASMKVWYTASETMPVVGVSLVSSV
jgi:hypothetical protein